MRCGVCSASTGRPTPSDVVELAELRALWLAKPGAAASRPFGPGVNVIKVADWIDDSYDLVFASLPRRVRESLTS